MAAHSLADDVNLIGRILVGMHQQGMARQLRQASGLSTSMIAKAAGCSPEIVTAWESGVAMPSTHQGLVWLNALHDAAGWRALAGEPAEATAAEAIAAAEATPEPAEAAPARRTRVRR